VKSFWEEKGVESGVQIEIRVNCIINVQNSSCLIANAGIQQCLFLGFSNDVFERNHTVFYIPVQQRSSVPTDHMTVQIEHLPKHI